MKATLSYLQAQLHLDISTLCMHLRNKAYPQKSDALYSAMSSVVYYQILVDELDKLLYRHEQLIESMSKFMLGEEFDDFFEEEPQTIYQYCLAYFEGDCALGSATPELAQWVASHADRNQILRQGVYSFFPDIEMHIAEEGELRPATEAERFESDTVNFLRDIETSNALVEFNQFMLKIRAMLEKEEPIADILTILNAEEQS